MSHHDALIPDLDEDAAHSNDQSNNASAFSHVNNRASNSPMGLPDQSHMYMPYNQSNQSFNQSNNQTFNHSNGSYLHTFNQPSNYQQPYPLHNLPPYNSYQPQQLRHPMNQTISQTNYAQSMPINVSFSPQPPHVPGSESNKRKAEDIDDSYDQSAAPKKSKSKSSKSKFTLPPCVSLIQLQRKSGPKLTDLISSQVTNAFTDMQAANYDVLSNVDEIGGNIDVKLVESHVVATIDERQGSVFDEYKVIEVALKKGDDDVEDRAKKLLKKIQKRAKNKTQDDLTHPPPSPRDDRLPDQLYVVGEHQRRGANNQHRHLHSVKWPTVYTDVSSANFHALNAANNVDGSVELCHLNRSGCVHVRVDKSDGSSLEFSVTQVSLDTSVVAEAECLKLMRRIKSRKGDVNSGEYESEEEFDSEEDDFGSEDDFSDEIDDEEDEID